MRNSNNVTVMLEVYNEAHRLEECLKCFTWAEELVVFVKESSDNTFEIAQKYATHVYAVDYCSASENILSNFAKHPIREWCFYITASSRIDPQLVKEIEKLTTNTNFKYDVVGLPYAMYVFGITGKTSPWGTDYKYLLIRKPVLKISTVLHQEIAWHGDNVYKIERSSTDGRFRHYTHANPDDFFHRHLRYVKYEAEQHCNTYQNKAFRVACKLLFRSVAAVLLKKRSIYRGRDGLVLSLAYVSYFLMLTIYVWYNLKLTERQTK